MVVVAGGGGAAGLLALQHLIFLHGGPDSSPLPGFCPLWRAGLTGSQHQQAENLRNACPRSPPQDRTKMTVAPGG